MSRTKSMGRAANGNGTIRKKTVTKNREKYTYYFKYTPIPGTARPNPYSVLARPTPPSQGMDIYNSMFED